MKEKLTWENPDFKVYDKSVTATGFVDINQELGDTTRKVGS